MLLIGMAAVTALLLMLAGVFHRKVPDTPGNTPPAASSDIPLAEVRIVVRPRYETAVGSIKSVHESAVAAKLLARVVEVNVKAGQAVSQGEVLVRLDDADLHARLKQAEATESAARARKDQAIADYTRAEGLISKNAISKAEYDHALAALKTATSDLERAEQAVREATILQEYAKIAAPISGIIVDKRVETGDTVTPGQTLLSLYDPARMQLVATVRESLALRLKVGQKLPARIESLGHDCEATVSEIVPEAAAASHSFTVKVAGPCPPGVYSGMFGRLLLPLDDEELVVVPKKAVHRVGQLALVDVVVGATVQQRYVQLGREIDGDYEVLAGLRPGEKVRVNP